jgi:parallel beta-helix repeat protein
MKMNDGFSRFTRIIGPSWKIVTILALLIILFMVPSITAGLLMQGPKSPGAVVNDTTFGDIPWVNPGNAATSDDAYATCTLSYNERGNYLKATNFGFAIPTAATINGILVEFEKDQDGEDYAGIKDQRVRIVKSWVIGSTNRKLGSTWPTSDTYVSHGSNSDLWNETWTPADINYNGFGVAISPTEAAPAEETARIDHIRITDFYTMSCDCGDLCVNETGWWRDGGDFNENLSTPIQAAVDNATAGETICVQNGTYDENVVVNVDNLTIRSESGPENCIVTALNTSKHVFTVTADWGVNLTGFTVQNATGSGKAGIYLEFPQHCIISENIVSNNDYGIYLEQAGNNNLTNNTATSNGDSGFYLYNSSSNNLTNNTATLNGDSGFYLLTMNNNNILMNNTANSNNESGFYLYFRNNDNTLTNNTANSNKKCGVFLFDQCNKNTLMGNEANLNKDYGIYLSRWSNGNNLVNNTANSNKDHGIYLSYDIYHPGVGPCNYNNLSGNTANMNSHYGIYLIDSCNNNTLAGNTANSNYEYGIYLVSSTDNNITGNTVNSNNYSGICLYNSSNNKLTDNTASNNGPDYGYGIWLFSSSGNNLTGNNASSNNYHGIFLFSSSNNNNLMGNTASHNDDTGIYLRSSSNNLIYNNYFNNTNNADDNGNNIWNVTKTSGTNIIGGPFLGGNYWSDYAGADNDTPPDGLGDTLLPYNSSGNIQKGGDWHPLSSLLCDCGDLCVNETGWCRGFGTFNENLSTPIQAAVDNATENETICVKDGNYTENVVVNVYNLTIRSENGPENCIVTANDTNLAVFYVINDSVNITGFTVKNAWIGILLYIVDYCTISENTVSNNMFGIGMDSSSNNTITGNTVSNNTYGIVLEPSSNNNILTGNTVMSIIHGIGLSDHCNNNTLTGNNASNNGGFGIGLANWCNSNIMT